MFIAVQPLGCCPGYFLCTHAARWANQFLLHIPPVLCTPAVGFHPAFDCTTHDNTLLQHQHMLILDIYMHTFGCVTATDESTTNNSTATHNKTQLHGGHGDAVTLHTYIVHNNNNNDNDNDGDRQRNSTHNVTSTPVDDTEYSQF